LFFEYPHCKHLPVELWTSKTSVETYGTGGKPDNCPPLSDFCLFNPDWPDLLPPVVLAGSEMDGRWPCLPPLQDESVGCFIAVVATAVVAAVVVSCFRHV
jgi:hypothetical protein